MRSEFSDDMGYAAVPNRWVLAYTLALHDRRAQKSLALRGLESYCPTYQVTQHLRRRVQREDGTRTVDKIPVVTVRSLFPRYLFVQVPPGRTYDDVRSAIGIESLVLQDGTPAIVPDELIEDLKVGVDMGLFDDDGVRPPIFKPGDAEKIVLGPFADFPAKVSELLEGAEAKLTLPLFGREFTATIPLDRLKRCA